MMMSKVVYLIYCEELVYVVCFVVKVGFSLLMCLDGGVDDEWVGVLVEVLLVWCVVGSEVVFVLFGVIVVGLELLGLLWCLCDFVI